MSVPSPSVPSSAPEDAASPAGGAYALFPEERAWLAGHSPCIWLLVLRLRERLFPWGTPSAVSIRTSRTYMAFAVNGNTFVSVSPQGLKLRLVLNLKRGELDDPDGLAECLAGKRHQASGEWRVSIANDSELERALPLVRQAFEAAKAKAPRKLPAPAPQDPDVETVTVLACPPFPLGTF